MIKKSFISINHSFSGCRFINDMIVSTNWTLAFKVHAMEDINDDIVPSYVLDRAQFWLETIMDQILVLDVSDEVALDVGEIVSNPVLYAPGQTTDEMIAILLHSKLSALLGSAYVVDTVTLNSSDSNATYTYSPQDSDNYLPETVMEYTGSKGVEKLPWWVRNDGWTYEFLLPDDARIDLDEFFSEVTDPLSLFDEIFNSLDSEYSTEIEEEEIIPDISDDGKLIKVDIWKKPK
jgi:hypothetical protein